MNEVEKKRLLSKILLKYKVIWRTMELLIPNCKRLRIESLYNYSKQENLKMKMLNESNVRAWRMNAQTEAIYENWKVKNLVNRSVSRQYVVEIEDVYIRSHVDGIIKDGLYLIDRVEWDANGMSLYPPIRSIAMNQSHCIFYDMKVRKNIKKGIFLINMYSINIFHLVVEVMGRLELIEQMNEYDDWPLILDERIKNDFRSIQFIDAMNKKKRDIIWLNAKDGCHVDKLLVPPCYAWGPMDINIQQNKTNGWIIDSEIMDYVRKRVLSDYVPQKKYKNVYVARGNDNRLTNESKIISYLSANGFEIFNPDEGDFWDEVECFATADCIVGCVGAAFTNAIFSKKDCKIVSICPFEAQAECTMPILDACGLENILMLSAELTQVGATVNKCQFHLPENKWSKILEFSRGS